MGKSSTAKPIGPSHKRNSGPKLGTYRTSSATRLSARLSGQKLKDLGQNATFALKDVAPMLPRRRGSRGSFNKIQEPTPMFAEETSESCMEDTIDDILSAGSSILNHQRNASFSLSKPKIKDDSSFFSSMMPRSTRVQTKQKCDAPPRRPGYAREESFGALAASFKCMTSLSPTSSPSAVQNAPRTSSQGTGTPSALQNALRISSQGTGTPSALKNALRTSSKGTGTAWKNSLKNSKGVSFSQTSKLRYFDQTAPASSRRTG